MAKEVNVQILGKPFTFHLADEISTDEFLRIVEYVENKITKIRKRVNELDAFKLGLLTAINITQDFFHLRKENERLREILGRIDTLLSPGADDEKLGIRFSTPPPKGGKP